MSFTGDTGPLVLVLASGNAHKAGEFNALSGGAVVVEPAGVTADVVEDAGTFAGNARLKALAHARVTGKDVIADDSGLCVDALDGAPGVYSARFGRMEPYADDDPDTTAANNRKLLRLMEAVPAAERGAEFVCALYVVLTSEKAISRVMADADVCGAFDVYRDDDGNIVRLESCVERRVRGSIMEEPSGRGGFGYDPLFYCEAAGMSFADLAPDEKREFSHRGNAFRSLESLLEPVFGV